MVDPSFLHYEPIDRLYISRRWNTSIYYINEVLLFIITKNIVVISIIIIFMAIVVNTSNYNYNLVIVRFILCTVVLSFSAEIINYK